jgi:hypothetical protein
MRFECDRGLSLADSTCGQRAEQKKEATDSHPIRIHVPNKTWQFFLPFVCGEYTAATAAVAQHRIVSCLSRNLSRLQSDFRFGSNEDSGLERQKKGETRPGGAESGSEKNGDVVP